MEGAPESVEETRSEKTFLGHPVGLYVLFFTEMWERFSYYGMRALLILYMIDFLKFSKEEAGGVYGDYTGLVYLTPLLGGFLADRYLGLRRSIILGAILMAIGQGFLALGYMRHLSLFYLGLIFLIVGNGLIKPNISTLVGQLYKPGDARRDSAFTIFYMGINVGATLAPLICGTIGQKYSWHWGFGLAGIGMILGLMMFLWGQRYLGDRGIHSARKVAQEGEKLEPMTPDEKLRLYAVLGAGFAAAVAYAVSTYVRADSPSVLSALRALLWPVAGTFVAAIWVFLMGRTRGIERKRVNTIFLLGLFVSVFWAGFEQAGSSLTLFAEYSTELVDSWVTRSVDAFLRLFGSSFAKLESSNFQSVNAFSIVLFAPLFSMMWIWLARRGREPSTPVKMGIGIFFLALGFVVIFAGAVLSGGGKRVSPNWLITLYVLHTFAELSLSPVGLSMVTKLAPERFGAMIMGVWFLSNAMGNKLAGFASSKYDALGPSNLFGVVALVLIATGLALFVLVPLLKRMMGGVK